MERLSCDDWDLVFEFLGEPDPDVAPPLLQASFEQLWTLAFVSQLFHWVWAVWWEHRMDGYFNP